MEYVIETFNLTKIFVQTRGVRDIVQPFRKKEIIALDNVNIKIKKGELFGILGPNGAGKSTLIKILCTLILPTAGTAYVNGFDVVKEEAGVKTSLGFVTGNERSFYWRLTGRQNLKFFAALNNVPKSHNKIDELLDIMELKGIADAKFYSYSDGMKQRMAIARGLLNDPEIIFMDEPTRSLDPGAAQNLREFVKEQLVKNQGKTVFMSTHQLDEAEQICDRIAIIDKSKIKVCDTIDNIKKNLRKSEIYTFKIINIESNLLDKLRDIEGIIDLSVHTKSDITSLEIKLVNSEIILPQIIEMIVNNGGKIYSCTSNEIALNSLFSQIIDNGGKKYDN